MAVPVRFHRLQPWAVLPTQTKVERRDARERAALYRDSFRFVRAQRRPEFCPPWVMGQELGWRVHSPIDVTLTPLDQVEVEADVDAEAAARAAGRSELWRREHTQLAVDRPSWLHLFQYATPQGWENMFLPNGAGTVEWRLGWRVDIPPGYFLLVTASDAPGAPRAPTGVLTSTVTQRMSGTGGVSMAIHPTDLTLCRGQEVARLILLHADSLQVSTEYGTLTEDDGGPAADD